MNEAKEIPLYKALVGSRLHGLATEESDYDYRSVHYTDLTTVLSPFRESRGHKNGDGDSVDYEIRHFLKMLSKGNPTALEVLLSDQHSIYSDRFMTLITYSEKVLDSTALANAHVGYARSQIDIINSKPVNRVAKAYVAGIRVCHQAKQLLERRSMIPNIRNYSENLAEFLMDIKYTPVERIDDDFRSTAIDVVRSLIDMVEDTYEKTSAFTADYDWIEDWLVELYKKGK
jgi:predicted nucleotidyltransferase